MTWKKPYKQDWMVGAGVCLWLLLILGATGYSGRQRSWATVCQLHLKRLGGILLEYTEGNGDRFPTRGASNGAGRWFYTMDYPESLRLCPAASEYALGDVNGTSSWIGSTTEAWGKIPVDAGAGRIAGSYGSYGINGWVYIPYQNEDIIQWDCPARWQWKTPFVEGASDIPMLLDGIFYCAWPQYDDYPPATATSQILDTHDNMQRFCLDRHQETINAVFMDGAARPVGLKELWTLKWHRQYNTAGPWTNAGGVHPSHWPEWMRTFKTY